MRVFSFSLPLLVLLAGGCPADQAGPTEPIPVLSAEGIPLDRHRIRAAAAAYVREHSPIQSFECDLEMVAEGHARLRLVAGQEETDPVSVYLRWTGKEWQGVAIGSDFTPEDFERLGIPEGVRPAEGR